MERKIALIGNPNSGKTTLFNALTGASQSVGNWPGVTVEKKEGKLKNHKQISLVDLPGVYSLAPYSPEEIISRDYLVKEKPDLVINVVDATNIERNLYLTTQILETGVPTLLALNMMDILEKTGQIIEVQALSEALGCPVIEISALKKSGLSALIAQIQDSLDIDYGITKALQFYTAEVEQALKAIEKLLPNNTPTVQKRYWAVKLFERDPLAKTELDFSAENLSTIEAIIKSCEEAYQEDSESIIISQRYDYVVELLAEGVKVKKSKITLSEKIDRIVTNRFLALPIFALVMWLLYFISVSSLGKIVTDWTNDVLFGTYISQGVSDFLIGIGTADWLQSLVVDGIIGGVGAVLGFVPQMIILFFLLGILENCGYMARIAFIMDRLFRKIGLSGKSFIPMLISSGCGVPGIMASRTIESEKDRRMTIMVTTFIPCSAKLPVIALIAGVFFGGAAWVAPSVYFLGLAMIVLSGLILKKTRLFAGETAPFVMELPPYHIPAWRGLFRQVWEKARSFIIKAGTVIFVSSAVIWFLSNFDFRFTMVEAQDSMLAALGKAMAPILAPLGFGNWQMAVATLTGLVAKESVVSTLAVLLGGAEEAEALAGQGLIQLVSLSGAYAFVAFNMLCAPCLAAIAAMHREMQSLKWTLIALGYQTALAYTVAFLIYQLGSVAAGASILGIEPLVALVIIAIVIFLAIRPVRKTNRLVTRPGEVM